MILFYSDSKLLGGSHGKHYCGRELKGRTLTTNGDSLRMEFKTDESLSFYGFKAVIKFVPNNSKYISIFFYVFSSPEPKLKGELIGWPCSGVRPSSSVRRRLQF